MSSGEKAPLSKRLVFLIPTLSLFAQYFSNDSISADTRMLWSLINIFLLFLAMIIVRVRSYKVE